MRERYSKRERVKTEGGCLTRHGFGGTGHYTQKGVVWVVVLALLVPEYMFTIQML